MSLIKKRLPPTCAILDTFTTRLGAELLRIPKRRLLSKKWPRWLTASCVSNPSSVIHLGHIITPVTKSITLQICKVTQVQTPNNQTNVKAETLCHQTEKINPTSNFQPKLNSMFIKNTAEIGIDDRNEITVFYNYNFHLKIWPVRAFLHCWWEYPVVPLWL